MRMVSHVSELPCLTLHTRLVCPQADGKATKQNSCPWQYKMSLRRRLRTITLDLCGPILWRTALQAGTWWCVMNPRALPPVTQGSALQAPECRWGLVMWTPILWRTAIQAAFVVCYYTEGVAPGYSW